MDKNNKEINNTEEPKSGFVLEKKNYLVLAGGFALIVLGFILMAGGKSDDPNVFNPELFSFRRITLAPILILLGFGTEIFAIIWRPKK
jgi:hypothetical protein